MQKGVSYLTDLQVLIPTYIFFAFTHMLLQSLAITEKYLNLISQSNSIAGM